MAAVVTDRNSADRKTIGVNPHLASYSVSHSYEVRFWSLEPEPLIRKSAQTHTLKGVGFIFEDLGKTTQNRQGFHRNSQSPRMGLDPVEFAHFKIRSSGLFPSQFFQHRRIGGFRTIGLVKN